MDGFYDRTTLMDLELQFQDDNTSCSSSTFSATISEDIDDLRLGAEANTFSSKYDESPSKRPVQKFEIMKENRECDGPDDPNYTISTISSISDLIDAREGNLDNLLQGLGFLSFEGEESHSSILSRFHSSPKRMRSENIERLSPGRDEQYNLDPSVHDGISKTQEWLDRQQNMSEPLSPTISSKDGSSTGAKTNGPANHNQPKRVSAQKKRSRWSKSRQSSFEHLLPNLEEEETSPDGDKSDSSSSSQRERKILPIRESSQEKENYSPDVNNCENSSKLPENRELLKKLQKLEIRQRYDQDAEVRILTDLHTSPQHRIILNQHKTDVVSTNSTEVVADQMVLSEVSPVRLSPWKHLGRKNLINMKVDSFELEEIVSNDGRLSPSIKPCGKTRTCHNDRDCSPLVCLQRTDSHCEENNELRISRSPSLSDSSSGFDEGLEDITPLSSKSCNSIDVEKNEEYEFYEKQKSSTEDSLHSERFQDYANKMAHSICGAAISECKKILWQKFDDFCASRSKIICASGVAEYALRMRSIKSSSRDNADSQSCLKSASWTAFDAIPKLGNNDAKNHIGGNPEPCHCRTEKGGETNSKSPKVHSIRNFRSEPKKSASLNINNNNANSPDRGRMMRFSSMPTLRWASKSPPCRKTSHHSLMYGATCAQNENSLMSSISDVTYLSYKRTSMRRTSDSLPNMQPNTELLNGNCKDVTSSLKTSPISPIKLTHTKQNLCERGRRFHEFANPVILTNGISHTEKDEAKSVNDGEENVSMIENR